MVGYRILIAQDVEYLRCKKYSWHKLKWNLIPNHRYNLVNMLKTGDIQSIFYISICNMVGIWLFINGHESDKEMRVRLSLRNLTKGVA